MGSFKELCQVLSEVIEIPEEDNNKSLIKDAMKLSEASFNKVWDNDKDAIYDKI
ncbi:MAG: toxin-antitoxin system, antitoxin component, Xre family protein [Acidobacteria bacterium]|nr:toxin-antitoxin system, antitoxin component, Xre family protein [Acidobacteriota bacterium]MCA1639048.1 toxin-antitoxin system, antitoxin component, Xre family protein [Acidobacteriota bacterium]